MWVEGVGFLWLPSFGGGACRKDPVNPTIYWVYVMVTCFFFFFLKVARTDNSYQKEEL